MTTSFKGIVPALITPMTSTEDVDENGLRLLVDRLIDAGVHGLFVLGTNGEFIALSEEEKLRIARITVEQARGRVPVFAGTGAYATRDVIALNHKMQDVGVDGVSVITPYFNGATQPELFAHYEQIARATSLPILLYTIPAKAGVTLTIDTVRRLADIPNIRAIKDSGGDFDRLLQLINLRRNDFAAFTGTDSMILWTLIAGGDGAVAATTNAVPHVVMSIWNQFQAGNISDPSNAFDFNLITGGTPSTPTITRAVDNVPGGVVGDLANNAWTNDNTPELHGKADPNSTVYIYDGSAFLGTVVASTSGDWVYTTPSRSDGKHDFTAVVKDAAGNESAASAKWTLYVDTVIATPTITSLYDNVGVDQGYVGNNGSTDDNTPTLSGSAEAGSTVYFYDGSRLLGTTIAATNGSWTYTTPALGLGAHHFKVTAIDRAGNSATSTDWSVNIINPAPTSVYENFESISGNAYLMNAGNSVSTANVDVRALSSGQETGIADFKQGVLERRNNGGPVEPVNPTSGKSLAVIKNGVIQVSLRNNLQATTFSALVGDLTEREQFHIKFYDAYGNFITSSDHYAGGPSSFSVNVTMPGGKSFSYFTVSTSSDASWVWIDNLNFTGLSYKTGSLSMSSMMAAEATGSDDATLGALEEGNPVVSNHASHPVSGEPNSENTGEHNGKVEATKEDSSPSSESEFVLTESNAATFEAHGSVDAIDTLKLTGADQVLDFSTLNGKVTSVEVIDITGTGDNTLKLSLGDVLEQGGKDLFIADGKTQMMVKGNAGDTVELSDLMPDGTDMGDWAQQNGTVTVEGSQYNVFVHEGLNTELLVQIGVQTNLDNH